jgi:hypothetical protein
MEKSKALIEKKLIEVNKMLHYINNSGKWSEEEREYYCGMHNTLMWLLDNSKKLYGYAGEII